MERHYKEFSQWTTEQRRHRTIYRGENVEQPRGPPGEVWYTEEVIADFPDCVEMLEHEPMVDADINVGTHMIHETDMHKYVLRPAEK